MAYYNQSSQNNAQGMNDDDEDKPSQSQPIQLSAQTSSIAPSAPSSTPPAQPQKSTNSGMGAGFQNYMKANQGNAQNRLNQATVQNVSGQGQQAKNAINQATSQFGQRMDQGSLANRSQAVQDVANVIGSARKISAGQNVDQAQQDRFKEVINARYQGPESLRQAGLYQVASGKVGQAQNVLNQAKTAQGREQMLQQMYQPRGDYGTGLNKLDAALLNANKQGVQNLQSTIRNVGNVQNQLDQAQIASSNSALNRAREITDIQEKARQAFTKAKSAEVAATEKRLTDTLNKWDTLPQYLRDTLSGKFGTGNKNAIEQFKNESRYQDSVNKLNSAERAYSLAKIDDPYSAATSRADYIRQQEREKVQNLNDQIAKLQDQTFLSQSEADLLGVESGQGLYTLGPDVIRTAAKADREQLITKDEQARQAVLSELAKLDLQNRLDSNLLYKNSKLAGTKTLLDAYDKEKTLAALAEQEKDFLANARNESYSGMSGGTSGFKPTRVHGNAYDLLQKAGYKTDKLLDERDLIKAATQRGAVNAAKVAPSFAGLDEFLNRNNFDNRINVQDNDVTKARAAALNKLLKTLTNGKA